MPGSTKTQPWKAVWPATESEATGGGRPESSREIVGWSILWEIRIHWEG